MNRILQLLSLYVLPRLGVEFDQADIGSIDDTESA